MLVPRPAVPLLSHHLALALRMHGIAVVGGLTYGALHCFHTPVLKMSIFPAFIASDRLDSLSCGTLARKGFLAGLSCVESNTCFPNGVDVCSGEVKLQNLINELRVLHVGEHVRHGELLDGHLHHARLTLEPRLPCNVLRRALPLGLLVVEAVHQLLDPWVPLIKDLGELGEAGVKGIRVLQVDPQGEGVAQDRQQVRLLLRTS